jgi:hypothetical protein
MSSPRVVQIVFGNDDVSHLVNVLFPSISDSSSEPVEVWAKNYASGGLRCLPEKLGSLTIHEFVNAEGRPAGFAENHNDLFKKRSDLRPFVLLNPDCILTDKALDLLFNRFEKENFGPGIIEGRQWPFEHPKEFDTVSLETPWASGAFCLINANFYESVGGMDESYFMYLEDVDLSWRSWLAGYPVIYEQNATAIHFSGGPFYRSDVRPSEEYYSLRNFIAINYKFFGITGEENAIKIVKDQYTNLGHAVNMAISDYEFDLRNRMTPLALEVSHPKIKVLGLNQFHKLRHE